MGAHARRRTRIEIELTPELRDKLNRMLLEGATYDDCAAWCKAQGFDISKSSVGRYGKTFFEAYRQVRQFEDQSKVLKSQAGDGMVMDEAVSKLILQKAMAALIEEGFDVMEGSKLISSLASLQNANIRREKAKAEFEERIRKQALEDAANAVETAAVSKGLDSDQVQFWREQVLGVK